MAPRRNGHYPQRGNDPRCNGDDDHDPVVTVTTPRCNGHDPPVATVTTPLQRSRPRCNGHDPRCNGHDPHPGATVKIPGATTPAGRGARPRWIAHARPPAARPSHGSNHGMALWSRTPQNARAKSYPSQRTAGGRPWRGSDVRRRGSGTEGRGLRREISLCRSRNCSSRNCRGGCCCCCCQKKKKGWRLTPSTGAGSLVDSQQLKGNDRGSV